MKKKFHFDIIYVPQKEGGFTVEVPDLPGCISEGDTVIEAQENIEEAIELYLETLQDRNIPLPERNINILKSSLIIEKELEYA